MLPEKQWLPLSDVKVKTGQPLALDLFAGAGGMALAASVCGVNTSHAIEMDSHAASTYAKNFPNTNVINDKIENFSKTIERYKTPKWDIIYGGPPCRCFSTSNQKNRSPDNPENHLFRRFIHLVQAFRPSAVLLENVPALLETYRKQYVAEIVSCLKRQGYQVETSVLNAQNFGVPQRRRRLFILAIRGQRKPFFPSPRANPEVTVREAISDLPTLSNGASTDVLPYATEPRSHYQLELRGSAEICFNNLTTRNNEVVIERYRHISQGQNWRSIPKPLLANYQDESRCHTGIYRRLSWNVPSVVIGNFRKNMLIHPEQDRGLSVREAARLQSFPDTFRFVGSIGKQQQQVGNAVPPRLAEAVFSALLKQLP